MGTETGGRKCDAGSRFCPGKPRKHSGGQRALTVPGMLDGVGMGNLCRLREQNHYGRELPVATVLVSGEVALMKWLKKEITKKLAKNAERPTPNTQRPMEDLAARRGIFTHEQFETDIRPQLVELVKPGVVVDWIMRGNLLRSGSITPMCRSMLTSIR